jgi:tRNA(fMet)-specific endonuclease VapC
LGVVIYVLDTDTIVALFNGDRRVAERVASVAEDSLVTTAINLAELYFGAFNSARPGENTVVVDRFRRLTRILPFESRAAIFFGRIKASLRRRGSPLSDSDLFIASVTLTADAALVTNNVGHFQRIEGLLLENWLR